VVTQVGLDLVELVIRLGAVILKTDKYAAVFGMRLEGQGGETVRAKGGEEGGELVKESGLAKGTKVVAQARGEGQRGRRQQEAVATHSQMPMRTGNTESTNRQAWPA